MLNMMEDYNFIPSSFMSFTIKSKNAAAYCVFLLAAGPQSLSALPAFWHVGSSSVVTVLQMVH